MQPILFILNNAAMFYEQCLKVTTQGKIDLSTKLISIIYFSWQYTTI